MKLANYNSTCVQCVVLRFECDCSWEPQDPPWTRGWEDADKFIVTWVNRGADGGRTGSGCHGRESDEQGLHQGMGYVQWSLTYPDLTYPDYSLIRTHVWEPILIPQQKVSSLIDLEIQLSGQSVWERRSPDKWDSTVYLHTLSMIKAHVYKNV